MEVYLAIRWIYMKKMDRYIENIQIDRQIELLQGRNTASCVVYEGIWKIQACSFILDPELS